MPAQGNTSSAWAVIDIFTWRGLGDAALIITSGSGERKYLSHTSASANIGGIGMPMADDR